MSRPLERQQDELACGPACAVMLAADRGVHLSQAELISRWRGFEIDHHALLTAVTPADLAQLLAAEIPGSQWKGGDTSMADPVVVLRVLASRSFAVLLGRGRIGHWVVVDGLTSSGRVLVRDPAGSRRAYGIRVFCELWYHQEAVFEVTDA